MAKREIVKIIQILQKLFKEKGIELSKVVLFGSYAKEKKAYSDIDIIVVSKDFRDKDIFEKVNIARGIHRKLVKEIMKPFDIMYYSDEEWENGNSLIINSAKKEGVMAYST